MLYEFKSIRKTFNYVTDGYAVFVSYPSNQVNSALAGETTSTVQDSANGVKELIFSDTEDFYNQLATSLQSKQAVNITTPYTSYSDFPPRMKQIFKSDTFKSSATDAGTQTALLQAITAHSDQHPTLATCAADSLLWLLPAQPAAVPPLPVVARGLPLPEEQEPTHPPA